MSLPSRRALAALLPLLVLAVGCEPTSPASTAATPEEALADSLVDAWIEAAGGPGAWSGVRTLRYTINTIWYDSTGAVRRMRPRRVELRKLDGLEQARVERPEAEGLYVQVFTGDTAWATLNGYPVPDGEKAATESEYVGRDVSYWVGLPWKLRDPGVSRRARPIQPGGWEVAVTFGDDVGVHPGDRYFYYFIDDDPFPEQVHYIEQDREEVDRNRTFWSAYQVAGPISYVGSRLWLDTLDRKTKELRIDDVWINPELPDSLFVAPVPGSP